MSRGAQSYRGVNGGEGRVAWDWDNRCIWDYEAGWEI
jgi:hypothetical protein